MVIVIEDEDEDEVIVDEMVIVIKDDISPNEPVLKKKIFNSPSLETMGLESWDREEMMLLDRKPAFRLRNGKVLLRLSLYLRS